MPKIVRGTLGQAIFVEWVMTVAIAITALSLMTVYVRRAYQARIYDADTFMLSKVGNAFSNTIRLEYEPYYAETHTAKFYYSNRSWRTGTGTYILGYGDSGQQRMITSQEPPGNYYLGE
jgi:hypothetical protein